jgi:hypothetical protein
MKKKIKVTGLDANYEEVSFEMEVEVGLSRLLKKISFWFRWYILRERSMLITKLTVRKVLDEL